MSNSAAGEVVVVNPLSMPQWNPLVAAFPEATVFHSANWARVLVESYGFTPSYLALFQGEALKGCLPLVATGSPLTGRRGVSLSFADSCCALAPSRSDFQRLFKAAVAYGREKGWKGVEFRAEPFLKGEAASEKYMQHLIELSPDEGAMHRRLRESTARNIRKAVREGVEVEFSESLQGVMEYYRLHCLTRKRHGVPPQPSRFFRKIHEEVIARGLGFTALARYRGGTVAGIICLGFGRNAMYKYGASDETFQQVRANNLLLWETIKRCAHDGYTSFSLGRTDLDNEGLLVFKNGWGAEAEPISYYRYDLRHDLFCSEEKRDLGCMKKMLRRMPVAILRGIGTLLYKYAG
ncbi:GNAT family N-acetyltransferase [Geomonas sp. RF6]|uniref:lipid II:glycine glycyltransferase FemX n=1 Tax=Geomonas sp. RF6 TaxID=2897342 RepID=UPI001E561013|nr:GNAT family N-acetyltransferase [Geomonas sp. RF6]UFS71101.1 GNAT family N-acetyltransferase [Geomonas sp. RF6]